MGAPTADEFGAEALRLALLCFWEHVPLGRIACRDLRVPVA